MKYLYYNRDECNTFQKCKAPSGVEVLAPQIELAFDDNQDFMLDFIKKFRELTDRSLMIEAIFNIPNSGPLGENSYITIEITSEEEWKLAFNSIEEIIKGDSDIVVEEY